MTTLDKVINIINQELSRGGFTAFNYNPSVGFKLTNYNHNSNNCFKVKSINEAEDIVINIISTAQKGNIFNNDVFDENKELFLLVKPDNSKF
jgi:hypothetical protein